MGLTVFREYRGAFQKVGTFADAQNGRTFSYDTEYLTSTNAHALSYSLPLRSEYDSKAIITAFSKV